MVRAETDPGQAPDARADTGFAAEAGAEDETDISVPPRTVADLEHAAAEQDADVFDEDMSLLLVERDQTNLTGPTSVTDPQLPQDHAQALRADASADEELALVETTRHRLPNEPATGATLTSATTNLTQDTQTTRSATASTQTSTRTYAPDNYDRTLMRLPSDDASKLFAGMKSDSDVVMTPEYAKKVFQSKSSAQRLQQYKIYGGIAFAILLVIAVYGLFEFQTQQENIDTSLRPLKRDPMPGLIRPENEPAQQSLFTEAKVDQRTLSLLESADSTGESIGADAGAASTAGAQTQADGEAQADTETAVAAGDETPATEMQTATQDEVLSGTIARQEGTSAEAEVAMVAAEAAPASAGRGQAADETSNLEISSSQRPEEKQVWLREAYDAYQAGNDELALSLYNKVLEVDPDNRNALLARAAIHVQNNNSADAIRDYQKLLLANPKDTLAMTSMITVANYSPRETETQLKLMLRESPDSPYLNFALANAYSAQDRWQEAQGYYFRALQGNPGDPNYAYNLAVSLEHIAQPRAAIAYYQRALDNFGNGLATFSRDVVDQRLEVLKKL